MWNGENTFLFLTFPYSIGIYTTLTRKLFENQFSEIWDQIIDLIQDTASLDQITTFIVRYMFHPTKNDQQPRDIPLTISYLIKFIDKNVRHRYLSIGLFEGRKPD